MRGHRDIAYRQSVLEEHGVTRRCITLTTPGTHVESPATARPARALVNDAFARVIAERVAAVHRARDAAAQRSGSIGRRTESAR